MKVLMFGWEFPPHISGGLGTACFGLTKGLAQLKNMDITFVVPKVWGDEDKSNLTLLGADQVPVVHQQIQFADTSSKIEYYQLQSNLIPYLGTSEYDELCPNFPSGEKRLVETTPDGKIVFGGDYGQNLFHEIENYAVVAEILARELDFDVIHVHDWMTFRAGMAAKRISGKPLVVHVHSTEFDRCGRFVNPAICALEKEGMEAADRIITVSNLTRSVVIGNYNMDAAKVITVHNAVEPATNESPKITRKPDAEKIVSFLGRITMQKGPEYFIEAANLVLQKMGNVRFMMAGKGDLRDAMIRRSEELNLSGHINFPGFLHDSEVTELFRRSDVFIMPSVSEPFGIVTLEAMLAGVPVVISKQSGVSEVLKNAVKVDYWNIQEMADSICTLLNDREFSCKLGESGRREAKKITWKKTAVKVAGIYLNLVEDNRLKKHN